MFESNNEEKKLDWMYKGATSTVDREEYLLGRSVDKSLEQLNATEKHGGDVKQPKNHVEHECIPPSIRDFKNLTSSEQVDLQQKLQEDPLVAIKKQEEETRKKLLQNPVQLKKLQNVLKQKSKEKKSKKKKKKKKSSSDDEDDNELDSKLAEKYLKLKRHLTVDDIKKQKKKKKTEELDEVLMEKLKRLKDKLKLDDVMNMSLSSSDDSSDSEDNRKKKNKHKQKKIKKRSSSQSSSSDEDDDKNEKQKHWKKNDDNNQKRKKRRDDEISISKKKRDSSSSEPTKPSNRMVEKTKLDKYDKQYRKRNDTEHRDFEKYERSYKNSSPRQYDRHRNFNPDKRDFHHKRYDSKASYHPYNERFKRKSRTPERKDETSSRYKNKYKRSNSPDTKYIKQNRSRSPKRREKIRDSESDTSDRKAIDTDNDKTKQLIDKINKQGSSSDTDSSTDSSSTAENVSDDERKSKKLNYGLVKADGSKISLNNHCNKVERKEVEKPKEAEKKYEKPKIKKLTDEEKERMRREMMENAKWRDSERVNNVQKYKKEDERESKEQGYNPEFLTDQLIKSASNSTVESRIKSNINNIQRSSKHMNSHFSRRY